MFDLWSSLIIMVPMIIAGTLHMVVVKTDFMSFLRIPIATSLFGQNKTLRGFIVMPPLGILGILSVAASPLFKQHSPDGVNVFALGAVLGFAYVLFELPNSFLKRRLGIGAGEQSDKYQVLFFILDRIDSALGCALAYLLFGYDCYLILPLIPMTILIHPLITIPLYLLGIKKKLL